jgi:acetylornithine/N-succinyldiaminopimelate aminotransferase
MKSLRTDLLFKHHIFTGEAKPNTVRLLPSLALKKDEADMLLEALTLELNQTVHS